MRMRLINTIAVLGLACAATSAIGASADGRHVRVSGTYSNLEYNEEGGDLLGIEIKIVPVSDDRFQGAILVSDGAPAPMILVDVRVSGRSVTFKVPASHGDADDAWVFQGVLSEKALKGTVTHSSGGKEQVTLPRRCGYWDH